MRTRYVIDVPIPTRRELLAVGVGSMLVAAVILGVIALVT